jgi:hypothetical protein
MYNVQQLWLLSGRDRVNTAERRHHFVAIPRQLCDTRETKMSDSAIMFGFYEIYYLQVIRSAFCIRMDRSIEETLLYHSNRNFPVESVGCSSWGPYLPTVSRYLVANTSVGCQDRRSESSALLAPPVSADAGQISTSLHLETHASRPQLHSLSNIGLET